MPAPIVLDVENVSRRFGDLVAVRDVGFQVRRSAIFGLLGPNGSGKSTIIRMLLGILPLSSGSARVLGYDVEQDPESIKRRVGYMSQQFSLYADLSVRENLEFYGRIYGLDSARLRQRMRDVLELTSLTPRIDQLAGTLSGGWKQRMALACALIHEPELVFLDEPTAGIDPVARRQLWDLLFELSARGVTLFVTTHYMDEAERCTDVAYIYMSRLLVQGKPHDLKQLPAVNPPGTRRLELRLPHPTEMLGMLREMSGVRDATLFGETVHLLIDDSLGNDQLLAQLGPEARNARLQAIPASLEDVFVTLTRQAERQANSTSSGEQAEGEDRAESHTADTGVAEESEVERPDSGSGPATAAASAQPARQVTARTGKTPRRHTTDGFLAILWKEFVHIGRQPSTLFFMLIVPVMQTIIFGYAIQTQIEHIPMVVYDLDGRRHAQELIEAFQNTRRFTVVARAFDQDAFDRALTSGRAKVGLRIPPDYSDQLVSREQASVQVLIDGSDSQVATTALNTAQLLGVNLSMALARQTGEASQVAPARDATGRLSLPIDMRPRLLYNPDLKSAHFFVPGLVGIILQLVTLFLTSFAIVRERELGTLEQLFVTPVGRSGLLLGKLCPYAVVGFVETLIVLTVMIYLFQVPVHGSILLLLGLSMLFMVCSLGLGLLVSTLAKTQLEAVQMAFVIMLPSVLLSGFMFPRSEMPLPIYLATFAIPVTYFIEMLRGIVLRGADAPDLWPSILGLVTCSVVVLTLSVMRFRKRLG